MTEEQQREIVNLISWLPPQKIIELVYDVFARVNDETERYAVVILDRDDEEKQYEKWWFDVIAPPSERDVDRPPAAEGKFVSAGICEVCEYPFWTWSPHPDCPVCGHSLPAAQS